MKLLRETIRRILLENKEAFLADLLADPNWDEGTGGYFPNSQAEKEAVYPKARKRAIPLKKAWAKHVDRGFVNSLVYIHWGKLENIESLIMNNATSRRNKDEISCAAYKKGEVAPEGNMFGTIGVQIQGHVSLLGQDMDNISSGYKKDFLKYYKDMRKTSGINRGVRTARSGTYILGPEDFPNREESATIFNKTEAFIDNWHIKSIVNSPTHDDVHTEDQLSQFVENLKAFNINIPIKGSNEL